MPARDFTKLCKSPQISRYNSKKGFELRTSKAPPGHVEYYDKKAFMKSEVAKSRKRAKQLLTVVNTISEEAMKDYLLPPSKVHPNEYMVPHSMNTTNAQLRLQAHPITRRKLPNIQLI